MFCIHFGDTFGNLSITSHLQNEKKVQLSIILQYLIIFIYFNTIIILKTTVAMVQYCGGNTQNCPLKDR